MNKIFFLLIILLVIGCKTTGDKKVDNFLSKYDEVVKKWETKLNNSELSFSDIAELNNSNMELLNEANNLKSAETWSTTQTTRYTDITLRLSKVLLSKSETAIQDFNNSIEDINKATKDFEREMQKLKDLY